MLSIFYPVLEIKLKHTWPCSKFACAYKKKKACIIDRNKPNNILAINAVSNSISDHDRRICIWKINCQKYEIRTIYCCDYIKYDINVCLEKNNEWTQ